MQILTGDALEMLKTLPDESVNCCVTSPPYWGLRDYGVNGQLGQEKTPSEYVSKLVDICSEIKRVLRVDGTFWLNIGDSYAGYWGDKNAKTEGRRSVADTNGWTNGFNMNARPSFHEAFDELCIKPKDLVGIPWRVAFALQDDGWYLRQDIIWHKPNPMPESVKDRCTKSHEYIFLLSKSAKYFYNADAIREPNSENSKKWGKSVITKTAQAQGKHGKSSFMSRELSNEEVTEKYYTNGRNKRDVWAITTKPYSAAHFATFPPELPELCIKAGCPKDGTVLDPFHGAGTTGLEAIRLQRDYIGIEINPEYVELSKQRIYNDAPLFNQEVLASANSAT